MAASGGRKKGKPNMSWSASRRVLAEVEEGDDRFASQSLTASVEGLALAAERSFAAAEAAEAAEMAASRAARRAVEAYCAACSCVGEAEFRKLLNISRSARAMTDTVARSAAHASDEYVRRKPRPSADPHVALRATQSALYTRHNSAAVATYIKSRTFKQ